MKNKVELIITLIFGLAFIVYISPFVLVEAAKIESGAILNLSLQISKDVPPVIVDAAMVRNVGSSSVGVEFLLWQQSERERLQLFVRGLLIGQGIDLEPLSTGPETLLPR